MFIDLNVKEEYSAGVQNLGTFQNRFEGFLSSKEHMWLKKEIGITMMNNIY
jgi:hypothetical protein